MQMSWEMLRPAGGLSLATEGLVGMHNVALWGRRTGPTTSLKKRKNYSWRKDYSCRKDILVVKIILNKMYGPGREKVQSNLGKIL